MLARPVNCDSERVVTAVLVSSLEYDHAYFDALFSRTKWRLFSARTTVEALNILTERVVPVILVDEQVEPEG